MNTDSFNLAAIDVGSNAARLLIKHVNIDIDSKVDVSKRLFLRVPLRLGMDVFGMGEISEERTREFVAAMKAYRQLMKVYQVRDYRACATSAMRDAKNGKQVLHRIHDKAKIKLRIISGDEESQIIYDNHLSTLPSQGCFLYVDVGGGSTETTFIADGEKLFSHSFNVGTIRMLKGKVNKDDVDKMKEEVASVASGHDGVRIIGSGGNINKLYRLASKKRKLDTLPVATLRRLYDSLSKMSVEERMAAYNLKPDRADVIVPAASIFLDMAASSGAKEIIVPSIGLADGLINEMLNA